MVAIVAAGKDNALRGFDGEVSVMLTDPAENGRTKRIARWDFTATEVREAWDSDRGQMALTVALPAVTPTDRPLRLWVRLVDRNGQRRLQATPVRFLANPLRLVGSESLATNGMMRRLPAPRGSEPTRDAVVQSEGEGWRATTPSTDGRHYDAAVAPASYEAW